MEAQTEMVRLICDCSCGHGVYEPWEEELQWPERCLCGLLLLPLSVPPSLPLLWTLISRCELVNKGMTDLSCSL